MLSAPSRAPAWPSARLIAPCSALPSPGNGAFIGTIPINPGANNTPGGLWALAFGNGVTGDSNTLFFNDGINGEANGLFGSISAIPEPSTWAMMIPRLRRRRLHGVSPEVEASIDGPLIHHQD